MLEEVEQTDSGGGTVSFSGPSGESISGLVILQQNCRQLEILEVHNA
jgi:hypothetical protein